MAKRVSHSVLDPVFMPGIRALYGRLGIPAWFPPEGIIAVGHLSAILAGVGFAYSTTRWWGGLLVALGVIGNHLADCWDGTHARATNQCRNGGELLDHFVDPLSFSYYLCGLAVAIGRLDWGLVAVICLYATSVLTNIKAKLIGEFTLASFGPTEFKTLLVLYGLMQSGLMVGREMAGATWQLATPMQIAVWFFGSLIVVGIVQLVWNLIVAVREVNRGTDAPDRSELEIRG